MKDCKSKLYRKSTINILLILLQSKKKNLTTTSAAKANFETAVKSLLDCGSVDDDSRSCRV